MMTKISATQQYELVSLRQMSLAIQTVTQDFTIDTNGFV